MYQTALYDNNQALQPVKVNKNEEEEDDDDEEDEDEYFNVQPSAYPPLSMYNYYNHSELDHFRLPPIVNYAYHPPPQQPIPIQYHYPVAPISRYRSRSQGSKNSRHSHHRHHRHHHNHSHTHNYDNDHDHEQNSRPTSQNENEKISIEINVADQLKAGKSGKSKENIRVQKAIGYSDSYAKRYENGVNNKRWISDTKVRDDKQEPQKAKFKSKHICSLCPHTDDVHTSFDNVYHAMSPRKLLTPIVKIKPKQGDKPKIEVRTTQRKNRNMYLVREKPDVEESEIETKIEKAKVLSNKTPRTNKSENKNEVTSVFPISLQYDKPVPVVLKPVQTQNNSDQQVYYLQPAQEVQPIMIEPQIQKQAYSNSNNQHLAFVQQDQQPTLVAIQQPASPTYPIFQHNSVPTYGRRKTKTPLPRPDSRGSEASETKKKPFVHHYVDKE